MSKLVFKMPKMVFKFYEMDFLSKNYKCFQLWHFLNIGRGNLPAWHIIGTAWAFKKRRNVQDQVGTNLRILFNKFHFISSMLPCTSTWIGPTTFIVCSTLVPWQSCVWRDLSGEDVFFLMRFEGPFCTSRRVPKLHSVFHSRGWLILEKRWLFFPLWR